MRSPAKRAKKPPIEKRGPKPPLEEWREMRARVHTYVLVELPTLSAIGLGPQLAVMERICKQSADGKYKGQAIGDKTQAHHVAKALSHIAKTDDGLDGESGESHLIHAAVRLLMAAAVAADCAASEP